MQGATSGVKKNLYADKMGRYPGGMTDKPYHHGDLRVALLTAAEAELAERGMEAFSLRSVAKRAGVSHAAPAHHFGDVQGLLTALATEGFRRFLDAMKAREAGLTDPRERAVAAGLGYLDFALARPTLFRLIFSSRKPDFGDRELLEAGNAAYDHLVGMVEALGGGLADIAALWAMAHGIADLAAGQRLRMMEAMGDAERIAMIRTLLSRVLP
jgi:AcrR family transcriptional regulator